MFETIMLYWIGSIFIMAFNIYCWHSLLEQKINFSKWMICLTILVMSLISVLLNYMVISALKAIIMSIFFVVICYILFKRDLKHSILVVVVSQMIIMISEVILVLLLSIIFAGDIEQLINSCIGGLVINVVVAIISYIFLLSKIPKKIFNLMVYLTILMKKREVLIYCIMIILVSVISAYESYIALPTIVILITNTIMAVVFIFMVLKFAMAEDKYARTNNKYQVSITSLKEYQEILDKFRVSTHENKNQLLTIKTMVKDPKVISYIEAIIDEKTKDNEKIMNKAYKIPDDRFRSLIYQKLCKIDELKIKYKFTISNDVKTADLIDMDDYLVTNTCSILGVYLDNAIEAVKDLKKKNIFLEIYIMDGYLCFDITNNFEGILDIDKLFKPKYTTKGEEHGYGLSVVSKIVRENDNIDNECEINKDMITQRLKVKM